MLGNLIIKMNNAELIRKLEAYIKEHDLKSVVGGFTKMDPNHLMIDFAPGELKTIQSYLRRVLEK